MKRALVFAMIVCGCKTSATEPIHPSPHPQTDGGDSSLCPFACMKLDALGCPEGRPTRSGLTCEAVCVKATKLRTFDLACISSVASVDEIRRCDGIRCAR